MQVGDLVPDFSAPSTSEKTFTLSTLKGKANVIIYFYPKDNTSGCTLEGQDFRDHYNTFQNLNTTIIGISRDTLRTHENFKKKQGFPFELISDTDELICKLFDVIKLKKLYGREYMGIERSTFLIDQSGILRHEWRKVKVKGHVDEVLKVTQLL